MGTEINRDDLMLMMNVYKESISASTALSEQQEVLIEQQKELIQEQRNVNTNIGKLVNRLDEHFISSTKMQARVIDKVGSNNELCTREFGLVKNQMYLAYVGMVTIVIALIGLIVKIF